MRLIAVAVAALMLSVFFYHAVADGHCYYSYFAGGFGILSGVVFITLSERYEWYMSGLDEDKWFPDRIIRVAIRLVWLLSLLLASTVAILFVGHLIGWITIWPEIKPLW